jgi:hypothetical protein
LYLTGNSYTLSRCYGDSFTFLYVDDVRTSQEAQASIACNLDSLTFLYVDDVRTSQEAQTSIACNLDSFTFLYVDDVRTSQETTIRFHGVTGIALLFYMQMMFVPHRKHRPPLPATSMALLFYM